MDNWLSGKTEKNIKERREIIMRSKWLISLGLVVCLVLAFTLPMCAPAPAPPVEEEKPPVEEELAKSINIYMGTSPTIDESYAKFIEKELGVRVNHIFLSGGELDARLAAESPYHSAEMVIGAGADSLAHGKEQGWFVLYDSPAWEGVSEPWADSDHYWVSLGLYTIVLLGNEVMLDEAGYTLPDSWDDLLDPKWEGELVMATPPTSSGAFVFLMTVFQIYGFNAGKGEEGAWEYWDAVDKNVSYYTKSSNAPTDLVGKGEFPLGVASMSNVADRIEMGYPLIWTVPKEGVAVDIDGACILQGTKELYTCQKIIDLIRTTGFMKLVGNAGRVTMNPEEAPSILFGTEGFKVIPNLDLEWFCRELPRLNDEWYERIGRKAQG